WQISLVMAGIDEELVSVREESVDFAREFHDMAQAAFGQVEDEIAGAPYSYEALLGAMAHMVAWEFRRRMKERGFFVHDCIERYGVAVSSESNSAVIDFRVPKSDYDVFSSAMAGEGIDVVRRKMGVCRCKISDLAGFMRR
ncbi:unnamed protein product, partial [marine sediment metagenome]